MGIGWHFYREGNKKLQSATFTSKYFLLQAKGPWAETFHELVPDRFGESSLDRDRIVTEWDALDRRWESRWSDEQKAKAKKARRQRQEQLDEFLAYLGSDLTEHRQAVTLWRERQSARDAGISFRRERQWDQESKLIQKATPWVAEVQEIEAAYARDLQGISGEPTVDAAGGKTWVDHSVTWVTLGVGVLLLLGLFTRLASLTGAGFLLSVMATQPFWISGTDQTYGYYQFVEILALLLLAVVGAGRFWGLDYFLGALRKSAWVDEPGDNDEFNA